MEKQPPEVFYKKGVLNIFELTGKHLRQSLFLIQLQVWGLQLYSKRDSITGVFCEFCKIF